LGSVAAGAAALFGGCTTSPAGDITRIVESSTLVGSNTAGAIDGSAANARFNNPVNVAVAADGVIFVADFDNGRVRRIDPFNNVSTLVNQANFARPFGITIAPDGTLFVQTDGNDLGARDGTTGTVWRVSTLGGATVVARDLGRPRGLLALPDGNIALADIVHHTLRILNPTSGAVTSLAGLNDTPGLVNGTGNAARFNRPYGMTLSREGDILVADANNGAVRRVTLAGVVTTVAGTGTLGYRDGLAAQAQFSSPQDVAVDNLGNILVADCGNHRFRRINTTGEVITIAGDGTAGFKDDIGFGSQFFGMEGIDITADRRTLIVADGTGGNDLPFHRIRRVTLP
jgi:hypothetical protein